MRIPTTPPLLLALALALGACADQATSPRGDTTPPLLEVLAPGSDSVLPPGPVRLLARCREDRPGGCTVEAFLQGVRVAQGRDSLDATVSLAEYRDQAVSFTFVATGTGGAAAATETRGFRVTRAPALEVLSPLDSTAPANPMRLRARCTTDAPGGCSVKVFLKGAATALAFDVDSIDARVPLPDWQGKAVRFVFVASDTSGARTTVETREIIVPTIAQRWIEVLSPAPAGTATVLADPARVRARCRGFPQWCLLQVKVGDVVVAAGYDSVDAPVVLAGFPGGKVRFTFMGRATGVLFPPPPATAETREFRIPPSRWTQAAALTVEGRMLDIDPDRVVYGKGDFVQLRTLATGAERTLHAESNAWLTNARLFPGGVLLTYPPPGEGKREGIQEVGGSGAGSGPGHGERVTGRWATWGTDEGEQWFHRDDVIARRFTRIAFEVGMIPESYDVAEDGTVVFTLVPQFYLGADSSMTTQLYRLRESALEQITFDTTATPFYPQTDGTNVVYTRRTTTAAGVRYQLMLMTPSGQEALSAPGPRMFEYVVGGGWVVFSIPDEAGILHLWTRSPAGELRRVMSSPTRIGFVMGPDLQVMVGNGGRMYFARTPDAALVDIGPQMQGSTSWFYGFPGTYFRTGNRLLRLDL
jgi:hypothetical protein